CHRDARRAALDRLRRILRTRPVGRDLPETDLVSLEHAGLWCRGAGAGNRGPESDKGEGREMSCHDAKGYSRSDTTELRRRLARAAVPAPMPIRRARPPSPDNSVEAASGGASASRETSGAVITAAQAPAARPRPIETRLYRTASMRNPQVVEPSAYR